MKIGEEDEAFAEEDVLALDGLLDLDHHFGLAPDVTGFADDFGSGVLVIFVGKTGERTGLSFNQYFVAGLGRGL